MLKLKALAKLIRRYATATNAGYVAIIAAVFIIIHLLPELGRHDQRPQCLPLTPNEVRIVLASEPIDPCNHTNLTAASDVADNEFKILLGLAARRPISSILPGTANFTSKFDVLKVYEKARPNIVLIELRYTNLIRGSTNETQSYFMTGFIVSTPGGNKRVITAHPLAFDKPGWTSSYSIIVQSDKGIDRYPLLPLNVEPTSFNAAVLDFAPTYPAPLKLLIKQIPGLKIGSTAKPGDRLIGIGYPEPASLDYYHPAHEPYVTFGVVVWTGLCSDGSICGYDDSLVVAEQHMEPSYLGAPQLNNEGEVVAMILQSSGKCSSPESTARCWTIGSKSITMRALRPYLDDTTIP